MALKDRMAVLTQPSEVDAFLAEHPLAVLFKAGMCYRSDETFARIVPLMEARADVPFGVIHVVQARAASDHLAARTGVRHESPQLLVFRDGHLVASRNHWDITEEALTGALSGRLATV